MTCGQCGEAHRSEAPAQIFCQRAALYGAPASGRIELSGAVMSEESISRALRLTANNLTSQSSRLKSSGRTRSDWLPARPLLVSGSKFKVSKVRLLSAETGNATL